MDLRYRLKGDPAQQMTVVLQRRAPQELDNIHKQVAVRLTTLAKANLENSRVREWESGQRKHARLTGTLTGKHGHSSAIVGHVLNRGTTPGGGNRQGKGVGWPDITILNRRARHWRVLEEGTPYVTMPVGVWVQGGAAVPPSARTSGQIFMPYREYVGRAGLSQRTLRTIRGTNRERARRARNVRLQTTADRPRGNLYVKQRGEGWQGKFFLRAAWEQIVGPNGLYMTQKYRQAFEKIFPAIRGR